MKILFWVVMAGMFYPYFLPAEEGMPITIKADKINFLQEEKKVEICGNVLIEYKRIKIFCEKAVYFQREKKIYAQGKVKVEEDKNVLWAEEVVYDVEKEEVQALKIRIDAPPLYIVAERGERKGKNEYVLQKGYVTTCSADEPCYYKLNAKEVKIYPHQKVCAKNVFLKIGEVPIFYLPYYSQSLKDEFPLELSSGKNKEWGWYGLSRLRYFFEEGNKGKFILDYYQKRGWGKGLLHSFSPQSGGEGLVKIYHIDDKLYEDKNREYLFNLYPERKSLSSQYLNKKRYEINISYKWNISSNLSLTSEFNKFSDENFVKDFFYRRYEREPHPYSYFILDYKMKNSCVSLLLRKRVNHFFSETEYLPQIEYNLYRLPLGKFLNFESNNKLGNLNFKHAHSDVDYDAVRLHSHNRLSLQKKIAWLNFNPYIGHYTTFYSKDSSGNRELWREATEAGVDLSTKLYKVFPVDFSFLGERVEKFRHVVTPTFTYNYLHPPSVDKQRIFQFDSVDNLERTEKIVFKLDNKLQAKNKERKWDFLYFSPSLEYRVNQEGKGSFFSNIREELEVYPRQGISLKIDSNYDVPMRKVTVFNIDFLVRDVYREKYSFSLGHRYVHKENTQGTLGFRYQINPRLQIGTYLRYEYTRGGFDEQQYRLRKYLPCKWVMDLGVDVNRKEDISVWVVFTLGPFPDVHFGFGRTYQGGRDEY